jgi:5-(aminomethyl)-3-furanmethanol phosphate kinase
MTGLTSLAVVKVGGSLLGWPELPERLTALLQGRQANVPDETIVLIAGGGPAADWIRSLDQVYRLGDEAAHRLAVQALDLTAAILASLLPRSITVDRLDSLAAPRDAGTITILSPRNVLNEIERPGTSALPASWDVTSDSIAARIAAHLQARSLVLIKSASMLVGATREDAARLGLVDPMLPHVARTIPQVEMINLRSDPLERRILLA